MKISSRITIGGRRIWIATITGSDCQFISVVSFVDAMLLAYRASCFKVEANNG